MALLTNSIITREMLRIFHQKATFLKKINRDYDDKFAKKGAKVGDTIQIRQRSRGKIREGRIMDVNMPSDRAVTLAITRQTGVDLGYTMSDLTLHIDDFRERYLETPIADMVSRIESQVIEIGLRGVYNQVGDPSTSLTLAKALRANMVLSNGNAPADKRYFMTNTAGTVQVVESAQTLFNSQPEIKSQYEDGIMGRAAGFDWLENTNMSLFTNGSGAGYQVASISSDGSVITLNAGTGVITTGTVFNIAGVYGVNPATKKETGRLQDFVALEDRDGPGTLKISPAIIADEKNVYRNVVEAPAANAEVTIKGNPGATYGVNLGFQRDFMTFTTVDMELPTTGVESSRFNFDGISMSLISGYDIVNNVELHRTDVLWGAAVLEPDLAVRVANNVALI